MWMLIEQDRPVLVHKAVWCACEIALFYCCRGFIRKMLQSPPRPHLPLSSPSLQRRRSFEGHLKTELLLGSSSSSANNSGAFAMVGGGSGRGMDESAQVAAGASGGGEREPPSTLSFSLLMPGPTPGEGVAAASGANAFLDSSDINSLAMFLIPDPIENFKQALHNVSCCLPPPLIIVTGSNITSCPIFHSVLPSSVAV